MNLSAVKVGMEVYHRSYGITKVLRKTGSGIHTRIIIEREPGRVPVQREYDPNDDEEEDDEEDDNEVSVRAGDLTPKESMTSQMHAREKERLAEKKAKEERELLWESWRQNLPEIPILVKDHLKNCCQDGMMSFLVFLNTDSNALEKLKQHAMYLLRSQVDRVSDQVESLEQDLKGKKEFLAMIERSKIQPKGVKIAKTA